MLENHNKKNKTTIFLTFNIGRMPHYYADRGRQRTIDQKIDILDPKKFNTSKTPPFSLFDRPLTEMSNDEKDSTSW